MTSTPELGKYGVWRLHSAFTPELSRAIESFGYGTIWLGGSPPADLTTTEEILDATETVVVATGIVNIWSDAAADVAASYHRLESKHPGRFVLGIGAGHPEATQEYTKPYDALVAYLDALDEAGVPVERRVLAALGPRVLALAADRTAGAHPYLTTPEHTRDAREALGPNKILAPEHKVVLESDPEKARSIGRPPVNNPYLHLRNYTNNLNRLGYSDEEIGDGGSDRLIDALVAHGTADAIAARLNEHLDAGASHVTLHSLPDLADPVETYREVAAALHR
ncbi:MULTISPECIES: LLM class F420-dependent oxidoreductase [unclassified Rhodococcus (in: high G+C Gram-positive bacteria)]|uniref:LLM class F420-dependent oxidoreductase n=1 Tax=unclassified Rhodococcus (in: high G+C Gram-positive bacteria) TaxID=192944 RepID=UPI0007BBD89A|nr:MULTISPECIES: LLM class F420-dependent oxidoreductase [unclassified Rhodococcus (in: high G+C Gram-positive bacteria)]KZF00158.1 LLM class F420-dependent oxidoreductase [Rhodococcus sp. EPR-147]KZF01654.1 LLM class F420-dependent oxidoreductase [Rhodococcus sp. EPR-279]MDV7991007.1 LLM class F420-dependent oxidoreductase [Rhodococcus sp. IEGM 1374]OZE33480.1 LLM class F420-dependent oxidoreductase [Rhodococcus sp. 05-2254-4]OZE44347.1 LLM class F420-dependent oxidoreductase [Rhodococcus sp.